jgi:hypothetical protein
MKGDLEKIGGGQQPLKWHDLPEALRTVTIWALTPVVYLKTSVGHE